MRFVGEFVGELVGALVGAQDLKGEVSSPAHTHFPGLFIIGSKRHVDVEDSRMERKKHGEQRTREESQVIRVDPSSRGEEMIV